MEANSKIQNYYATRVDHHAVNWSGEDILAYMECMEDYQDLPIGLIDEGYLQKIMEDVLYEYEDYIIEKINFFIQEHLEYHKKRIITEIKTKLDENN